MTIAEPQAEKTANEALEIAAPQVETSKVVDAVAPVATVAITKPAELPAMSAPEKSHDWENARKFGLPARLAVTAQLNRPKVPEKIAAKKAKTMPSSSPRRTRIDKAAYTPRRTKETGGVIAFPTVRRADQLDQAA